MINMGEVHALQNELGVQLYEVAPPPGEGPQAWIVSFWSETEDTKSARFSDRDAAAAFMGAIHDAILETYRKRPRGVVR